MASGSRTTSGNRSKNTGRNSSGRNSAKKNSTKRTSSKSRSGSSGKTQLTFADYFYEFSKTRFFRPTLIIVGSVVIVLLDLLFSWNNFEIFFKILGFEIILAGFFWLITLVFKFSDTSYGNED